MLTILVMTVALVAGALDASAHARTDERAARLCATIEARLQAEAGASGPAFLQSYLPGPAETVLPPELRRAAHVYDNALAAIALQSCDRAAPARRLADALIQAVESDRFFSDGRIRNVYRSGRLDPGAAPALPGWWNAHEGTWVEDGYAAGSTTGNAAWAALALLHVHAATGDRRTLAAAERLMRWIMTETVSGTGVPGFTGGRAGHEPHQAQLAWKSTEHNVDVSAAAGWLFRITGDTAYQETEAVAATFVSAMSRPSGNILVGTLPDGRTPNADVLALDAMLWPVLAGIVPEGERRAVLAAADRAMAVDGGYDFNDDRDGIWVEGTAQAAATLAAVGRADEADALIDELLGNDLSSVGYLFATRSARLSTGFADPSGDGPVYYFRRPHLGASAWAILAANRHNPFSPTAGSN